MPYNVGRRGDTYLDVPGTLADHVGRNWLWLYCVACNHARRFDPAAMARRFKRGVDKPLAEIALRAKCQHCEFAIGARVRLQRMKPANSPITDVTGETIKAALAGRNPDNRG